MHEPPALHTTQLPPLQTIPLPHVVPAALFRLSAQTDVPVEQEVVPVLHALAGWQALPATQVTHMPALQTNPDPQPIPSASETPLSPQTPAPVLHESVPVWQGLDG